MKQEGKVPSRLALGNRAGYNGRCWGSPVRQKKKHTGRSRLGHTASSAVLAVCWAFSNFLALSFHLSAFPVLWKQLIVSKMFGMEK